MEPAILHQHNSGFNALHINKVMKLDPTRTTLIRRAFMKEVTRRFTSLKKDIYVSIAENDVFGLNAKLKTQVELRPGQFDFPLDMDKVNYFMDWLDNQVQLGILGIGRGVGRKEAAYQSWQNVYIDSSYKKGIFRAQSELKKAGIKVTRTVDASFASPTHVDRVGMIYSRAYDGLKNITSKMSNQIGSTLATGLAEGRSPRELARILNDRVDKIGITRARTLARTEVVRAHHKATIGEYREYQNVLDGVTVLVEWNTAGYDVCEECSEMNGKVYTMDQIEELIPYHPNCRCVALPYIEKLHGKGVKSSAVKKATKEKTKEKKSTPEQLKKVWDKATTNLSNLLSSPQATDAQIYDATVDSVTTFSKYAQSVGTAKRLELRRELTGTFLPSGGSHLDRVQQLEWLLKGTETIPLDVIYSMSIHGYRVVLHNSPIRESFVGIHKAINLYWSLEGNSAGVTIAHEFSHAMDNMFGWFGKLRSTSGNVGFRWNKNPFSTKEQAQSLVDEFRSLISRKENGAPMIGTYRNGDGNYFKDNWIDNYEGRIYRWMDAGDGVEWWSVNYARYHHYTECLSRFDSDVAYLKKSIARMEAEGSSYVSGTKGWLEYLLKIGRDGWAAKESQWDIARRRYPKLSKYIEDHFGVDKEFWITEGVK